MLVLSRQKDETICIGGNLIRVTIVDIRGDKVRIGVDAPKEMTVHREEVYEAIAAERRAAAAAGTPAVAAAAGTPAVAAALAAGLITFGDKAARVPALENGVDFPGPLAVLRLDNATELEAGRQGAWAYAHGFDRRSNPYAHFWPGENSAAALNAWYAGWDQAEKDDEG